MDRATIEARIDHGLGIAAAILGQGWTVYRPTNAMSPLATVLTIVQGAISADAALKVGKPAGYGNALRYWIGDSSALKRGDVLVNGADVLFVADCGGLSRTLLVDCNETVTVSQWNAASTYGGGTEQVLASGWPASVLLEGRGVANQAGLPGDARDAGWEVLMPLVPGVTMTAGMQVVDAVGRRFLLSGIEQSALGLRMTVTYAGS